MLPLAGEPLIHKDHVVHIAAEAFLFCLLHRIILSNHLTRLFYARREEKLRTFVRRTAKNIPLGGLCGPLPFCILIP